MGKTSRWYQRHVRDAYVRRAKKEGRRSRAAFKLKEIIAHYGLPIHKGAVVVDLGCAPGSWCQEAAQRVGKSGLVVGIDRLPVAPIPGVVLIQADFTSQEGVEALEVALQGRACDMLLSDMAPDLTGNKAVDQANVLHLNELTLAFASRHLRPGGGMLLKTFMGEGVADFKRKVLRCFEKVRFVKPAASRKRSAEIYLLALGYKGIEPINEGEPADCPSVE